MLPWLANNINMRSHKFLLTITLTGLCLLMLSSCGSEKIAVEAPVVEEEVTSETTESQVELPQQAEPVYEGPRKVVGAFKSVKGVMDPLSCYCSNGGYVDSPAGETVPVCFDNSQEVFNTDYIFIEGVMTTRTIESNGACPEGTMSYLVVESYSLNP